MESKKGMQSLEKAAVDSIANEKSKKVLSELAELIVDDELKEEVLDQLPILRYRGVYKSIRDAFFFNKFCKFLEGLSSLSQADRASYLESLSDEEKSENGKYLVTYIDRLDDELKPEIAGRIFSEFVIGRISKSEMLRFNYILALLSR